MLGCFPCTRPRLQFHMPRLYPVPGRLLPLIIFRSLLIEILVNVHEMPLHGDVLDEPNNWVHGAPQLVDDLHEDVLDELNGHGQLDLVLIFPLLVDEQGGELRGEEQHGYCHPGLCLINLEVVASQGWQSCCMVTATIIINVTRVDGPTFLATSFTLLFNLTRVGDPTFLYSIVSSILLLIWFFYWSITATKSAKLQILSVLTTILLSILRFDKLISTQPLLVFGDL